MQACAAPPPLFLYLDVWVENLRMLSPLGVRCSTFSSVELVRGPSAFVTRTSERASESSRSLRREVWSEVLWSRSSDGRTYPTEWPLLMNHSAACASWVACPGLEFGWCPRLTYCTLYRQHQLALLCAVSIIIHRRPGIVPRRACEGYQDASANGSAKHVFAPK